MWGKTINSGQVCIAPDYALVHESKVKAFVEACMHKLDQFYPEKDVVSPYSGMMINKFHTDRIKKLIDTCGGKIVCGGKVDVEKRHVQPTIILEPKLDSDLMQQEIFGCVLPVIPYSTIRDAVEIINSKDKPLTVYYFGKLANPNCNYVAMNTSSGHFVANEVLFQFATAY